MTSKLPSTVRLEAVRVPVTRAEPRTSRAHEGAAWPPAPTDPATTRELGAAPEAGARPRPRLPFPGTVDCTQATGAR